MARSSRPRRSVTFGTSIYVDHLAISCCSKHLGFGPVQLHLRLWSKCPSIGNSVRTVSDCAICKSKWNNMQQNDNFFHFSKPLRKGEVVMKIGSAGLGFSADVPGYSYSTVAGKHQGKTFAEIYSEDIRNPSNHGLLKVQHVLYSKTCS